MLEYNVEIDNKEKYKFYINKTEDERRIIKLEADLSDGIKCFV